MDNHNFKYIANTATLQSSVLQYTYLYGQGGILHFLMCILRWSFVRLLQNKPSAIFLVELSWQ